MAKDSSSIVHEVEEVYVYIPPELSAAGVELKIVGSVKVVNKEEEFHLTWSPTDLSQQDVATLYLAQADSWAMVDQIVEPPEMIEERELSFPDTQYSIGDLDSPDPILMSPTGVEAGGKSPMTSSPHKTSEEEEQVTGIGVRYSRDGEAHISGVVSQGVDHTHLLVDEKARQLDTVNFALSQLHSIKESTLTHSPGGRSLKFFLLDGSQPPTLHFHDGGTGGLLTVLQRYVYLEKHRHDHHLYLVKEFNKKSNKTRSQTSPKLDRGKAAVGDIVTGVFGGAMGNIIGITRAVRQHLIPDHKLQDVRPGTEGEDEFEEKIQTVAMSEAVPREGGRGGRKDTDPDMSLITDFQVITDIRGKLPPCLPPLSLQPPLSSTEWESLRDGEGRIGSQQEMRFRARVFAGGIEPAVRKEAWRYLLNYFPFYSSDIERMEMQERKEREYWQMKGQWQSFTGDQERRFYKWREAKTLINKDVLRTDRDVEMFQDKSSHRLTQMEDILRTYVMYNFDLGYVQGMSDLLAPLLVVMDNEVDTFWCFVGFMDMVGHHFEETQTGMRNRLKQLRALLNVADPQFYQFLKSKETNNLYFCFRWLLIHFKREFDYPVLMRLWEVIWTGYLSPDYPLFIALAILETEKGQLFNPQHDFSDILQHINGLAKKIPLEPTLQLAEVLCRQLGACSDLPDDLKCLVARPPPKRFASIIEMETIFCSPDGSAVPSGNCAASYSVPSVDISGSDGLNGRQVDSVAAQSLDCTVPSENTTTALMNYPPASHPVQSGNGPYPSTVPNEDSIQSTTSSNDLVV